MKKTRNWQEILGYKTHPPDLATRHRRVLRARIRGEKLGQIAEREGVTPERVRHLIGNILMKIGFRMTRQLGPDPGKRLARKVYRAAAMEPHPSFREDSSR